MYFKENKRIRLAKPKKNKKKDSGKKQKKKNEMKGKINNIPCKK
jgi:hypothetical protein